MEAQLISIILFVFGLHKEAVFTRARKRELVICRQTIHYFAIHKLKYSLSNSGAITRHTHCTAINSVNVINNIIETNYFPYAMYIKIIKKKIEYSYKDYLIDLNRQIEKVVPKIKIENYIFYDHSKL